MSVFDHIESVVVPKSNFNLSHNNLTTMKMGYLYPTLCLECYPGDFFNITTKHVVRLQPMLAPIMHQINITHHFFFVPYRIIDKKNWEDFITGGAKGNNDYELPTFKPEVGVNGLNSLWDYLGFPLRQDNTYPDVSGVEPIAYPFLAYHRIWNEWYRDEDLIDDIEDDLDDISTVQDKPWFNTIRPRAWEKDYFTIARPSAQKGTAPAVNVSLSGGLGFNGFTSYLQTAINSSEFDNFLPLEKIQTPSGGDAGNATQTAFMSSSSIVNGATANANFKVSGTSSPYLDVLGVKIPNNFAESFNLSGATAQFDISQLRLAVQMQKWLERNMRAGNRYIEFLLAHFGIAPNDARLQRPEYIGGTKAPIISSEVLQTSATGDGTTPLGSFAGHGISADKTHATKYAVKENGVIMCITSVLPRTTYSQGVNRQWLRRSRYDFYSPEFAHLSEQMVLSGELYADGDEQANTTEFGFQGRFNELRYIPNRFGAQMRNTFAYYHLGRWFHERPILNSSFVQAEQVSTNPFAVTNEDTMICNIGFEIMATRPMPYYPTPGLLDHF